MFQTLRRWEAYPRKPIPYIVCLQDSEARDLKTNEIIVITNIHVHVSSHCNLMIMNFMQINFVNIGIANTHFNTPNFRLNEHYTPIFKRKHLRYVTLQQKKKLPDSPPSFSKLLL